MLGIFHKRGNSNGFGGQGAEFSLGMLRWTGPIGVLISIFKTFSFGVVALWVIFYFNSLFSEIKI